MSASSRFVTIAVVLALATVPATACSQQGPASKPTTEKIQSDTQAKEQQIDQTIESVQATVTALSDAVARLDSQVDGLQASGKLQEIQKKLTDAVNATGDAKTEAVRNASAAFTDLIGRIDKAASEAPAGSERQTALRNVSAKLKSAQMTLAAAVEGSSPSTSTTP